MAESLSHWVSGRVTFVNFKVINKRRFIKVLQISDEYVPCLESGNFDVNSCVGGVMIAD